MRLAPDFESSLRIIHCTRSCHLLLSPGRVSRTTSGRSEVERLLTKFESLTGPSSTSVSPLYWPEWPFPKTPVNRALWAFWPPVIDLMEADTRLKKLVWPIRLMTKGINGKHALMTPRIGSSAVSSDVKVSPLVGF